MNDVVRAVTWEAPEHRHVEKGSDWFWVVGIIAISGAAAAFFLGNFLFALLILIGAVALALASMRKPRIIPFSVSVRGVVVGDTFHPYASLDSFYIDEMNYEDPQLLIKSRTFYMPLLVIPLPDEYLDEIEQILSERLPEEVLEEPLANILLEAVGF